MSNYPHYTVTDNTFLADAHNGNAYHAAVYSETVADDGQLLLFLQTNNDDGNHPHVARFRINAGGLAEFKMTEACSIEAGATGKAWTNYNLASPNTNVATLLTVTSFSNGTVKWAELLGGGSAGQQGQLGERAQIFILADSSHYCLQLINRNGNAQPLFLAIDFVDRD